MASAVNVDFWKGNNLLIRVKSSCCPGVINHSLQVFWTENFNITKYQNLPSVRTGAPRRRKRHTGETNRLVQENLKLNADRTDKFPKHKSFFKLNFRKILSMTQERGGKSCWIMIIIIMSNRLLQMRSYRDCVSFAFLPSSWSPSTTHPRTLVLLRLYGPFSSWVPSSSSPPSPP